MTILAHYDAVTGAIRGFYETALTPSVPIPNRPVSAAEHNAAVRRPHRFHPVSGAFEPVVAAAPGLEALRARALIELTHLASAVAEALVGDVPAAERDSWSLKLADAQARLAGSATPAAEARLQAEADFTGETLDALAQSIADQAAVYDLAARRLAGIRRAHRNAIVGASTVEELEAALDATRTRLVPGVLEGA